MARERIYTKKGDDGTTGLFYGGRVRKDSELPTAYGTVDEAQAVLGIARARSGAASELDEMLVRVLHDAEKRLEALRVATASEESL